MSTLKMEKRKAVKVGDSGPINTLQQLWDATIAYQQAGEFDTTAMYDVNQRMSPKLTYQDIANVFSAVYADTYWNVIQMDYKILSKSMQSALGLSTSLADQYSQTAMSQWRGAFTRNNISDVGRIPSTGNYTASLDIVCNNDTQIPPQALIQNWNNEYWQTPQVGKNYVYVRCQNLGFQGDLLPKVRMFFTSGGFNQPPSSWQQLFTTDGTKAEGDVILVDGDAGPMAMTIRGASESFFFNPTSADHVCIIGVVGTSYFANPLNIAAGNWNSLTWLTCNGAACWHNVDPTPTQEAKIDFYNQDGMAENFVFNATCRNVPTGAMISLSCSNPKSQFDTGSIAITHPNQVIEVETKVPAFYKGELTIRMEDQQGHLLPKASVVIVTMDWKLNPQHANYHKAIQRLGHFNKMANGQSVRLTLGTITFVEPT